ncbi:hypothetical protein MASR2M29_07980 [Spirochaetota bacterium]
MTRAEQQAEQQTEQPGARPSAKHGGDLVGISLTSGLPEASIIDASANINPLGPPEWLDAAFMQGRLDSGRYPDPEYRELKSIAASYLKVDKDCLVFGNGADELMFALARLVAKKQPRASAIVEEPSYASYRDASLLAGLKIISVKAQIPEAALAATAPSVPGAVKAEKEPAEQEAFTRLASAMRAAGRGSILWLGAPNNPTGIMPPGWPHLLPKLAGSFPEHYIAIDEAFADFCTAPDNGAPGQGNSALGLAAKQGLKNIIILRSMTKFWGIPGLRLGYAIAAPELAIALREELPNWPLNSVAEAAARLAFTDPKAGERRLQTLSFVSQERKRMAADLSKIKGLTALSSDTNYYLVKVAKEAGSGSSLALRLAEMGIGIRRCDNFNGLGPAYIRIAVRTEEENSVILKALGTLLEPEGRVEEKPLPSPNAGHRVRPAAKALMIQGCSSGAGKSIITAAFCRIFREQGIRIAPYKAQNMSGFSAKLDRGLEISQAQAIQAMAAGIEPEARMNPLLLKPKNDYSSDVYLMGKHYASLGAKDYYALNSMMKDAARAAYDSLASDYELVILEGAGSPAEINLKARDFVNMGAAIYADAKVLLVGDIDRGGVFASFIGHTACFSPMELRLLSGFVVNKFRGDPALLGDAFSMTKERTGRPVLGCIPMIKNLAIPEEDDGLLQAQKEKQAANRASPANELEAELSRLAAIVKANVDMPAILAALGL